MPGSDQNKRSQKFFSFTVRQSPLVARIAGGSTTIIYAASPLSIKSVIFRILNLAHYRDIAMLRLQGFV